MADLNKFLPIVHYYARANYPRHLQTACEGVLKRSPGDPVPQFWLAFGKLQEGRHAEALQDLQMLPPSLEISPATTAAMILGHQSAKIIDHEAVQRLTSQKQMLEESCSSKAMILLAQFYWLTDSIEQARMLVERVVHSPENHQNAQALLGWLMISQKDDEYGLGVEDEIDDAISLFDAILEAGPAVEALMGKAKALELKTECKTALEVIREVMARYPWFYPATIECIWALVRLGEWNEASEMADGILQADSQCIDALYFKVLFHILFTGNKQAADSFFKKLENSILTLEPRNAKLCFQTARLLRRVVGDSAPVKELQTLAKCACTLVPERPVYACEHGYQQMLTKDYDGALQTFQEASNLNEISLDIMCGTVDCLLQKGMMDDAALQLEMLTDVMTSAEALSETGCLKFQLLFYRGIPPEEGALVLEKAFLQRQKDLENLSFGKEFLEKLNITEVLDIVSKVLQSLGNTPKLPIEASSPYITKINRILSSLLKHAPGHIRCQLLLAQAQYLEGSFDAVMQRASAVQHTNPGDGQASLLLCQVYLHKKNISGARIALDEAVAASFSIRDLPCYHIVNAQVLMAEGRLDEAKNGLIAARDLVGFKSATSEGKLKNGQRGTLTPTLSEKASMCLLLAEVLEKIQKGSPEAIKVINDGLREFEGTSEAVRITIKDCELAVNHGDIQAALKKLMKIDPKSPYFSKARMAMANIYLYQKKDKAAYVKCYLNLSEQHPGFETSLMLGEALMSIQEPEKAIKAFENALEINPKDSDLACRIAEALVTTHEYQKAVDFYKKAIRNNSTHLPLQQKLGSLLVRLGRDNDAIEVFNRIIEVAAHVSGAVEQQTHIADTLFLLSFVYKKMGYAEDFLKALREALSIYIDLLSKLRGEHPDIVAIRREKILTLSIKLSEHYIDEQQFSQAEQTLFSGLEHCSEKKDIRKTLARLYLVQGHIAACEEQCMKVLKEDPAHEGAGLMLSEVMFHQGQHSSADTHFLKLLGNNPCDFVALKNLMKVLRYAGRVDEIEEHIKKAESGATSIVESAGMHFCKGLFSKFQKQQNDALAHFGLARKDPKWATDALYEMVRIILNPEQEVNWLVGESVGECQRVSKSARSLLEQVSADEKQSVKYKVLWGYTTMATKQPGDVQMALSKLLEVASEHQNHPSVLLSLATGFMISGQIPKARNQLKRLQKIQVKMEEIDEFERAWLLLADIYMEGGKHDLAQDLCKKCLKYNKSCSRAWECLGLIMEKEQSYRDAAENYEFAWRYENEASAEVGYKLAFNFLKADQFVEAIDVCHKVLKVFPDCPRIQEEILHKAIGGLRP